ncbi:MAG: hypothetical protein WDA60_03095 [Acidimicrobiia bacterium]
MTRRRGPAAALALALALALIVAAGLGLAACGGGDSVKSGGSGGSGGNGNGGTEQTGGDAAARAYVGLTKSDAIAKAEADGRKWRITREDGTEYAVTFDYDPERLNFEIDKGTVTMATFG